MTEWKMVHGEGDDPLGPKTYVAEAYGVKFNPPISQVEVGALIAKLGKAMREYVKTLDAHDKMYKSILMTNRWAQAKYFARLWESSKKNRQTLVFVEGESQKK